MKIIKINTDGLMDNIEVTDINTIINQDVQTSVIRVPHSQSSMLDEVYKTFTVNSRLEEYDYVEIEISGNPDDIDRLKEYIV